MISDLGLPVKKKKKTELYSLTFIYSLNKYSSMYYVLLFSSKFSRSRKHCCEGVDGGKHQEKGCWSTRGDWSRAGKDTCLPCDSPESLRFFLQGGVAPCLFKGIRPPS